MFKLIKINNSPSNTPEIEKVRKLVTLNMVAGEAVLLESGRVARCTAYDRPTHITLHEAKAGDNYVYCYRVTSDMIFEADCYGTSEIIPGDLFPLVDNGTKSMIGVAEPEMEGPATALGSNGKKVILYFK